MVRERALKVVLVLVGLLFSAAIYPAIVNRQHQTADHPVGGVVETASVHKNAFDLGGPTGVHLLPGKLGEEPLALSL